MKGALGFFGVFLSVLSDVSHGETNFTRTLGCGNKTAICGSYCDICDDMFFSRMECYSNLFQIRCYAPFVQAMDSLNNTDWCIWNNVRSLYNSFTLCTEEMAECLLIPWPNPLMQHTFVDIHSMFFRNCPDEALSDPPPGIVFALVMTPICLIPVMVVLVVLKTKNGDSSS